LSAITSPLAFTKPARLLQSAIGTHAFPAAVIEVGRRDQVLWREAFGALTYLPDAQPATERTLFDLASLTKVIATTWLTMRAVDAERLGLDDPVSSRVACWRGTDREGATVRSLLAHASGLTAYLPFFRDHHGRVEFERGICEVPLEYAPGTQSIYSDLGFILLGFILEDVAGHSLADQFARLWRSTSSEELAFNPLRDWRERTAPTELDLWRGRLLQGEVHDENAWALGGSAGHAGLFGSAAAVGTFARLMLEGLAGDSDLARADTVRAFATRAGVPGSSRALGWDTMLPSSSCGTRLSPRAIGHTGFTGTSLWIDPDQDLYIVLLTNRVHPARDNNGIQRVRRDVHDAVVDTIRGRLG
jgi:CubicO group peptidase (beta-lactamase class C family)